MSADEMSATLITGQSPYLTILCVGWDRARDQAERLHEILSAA